MAFYELCFDCHTIHSTGCNKRKEVIRKYTQIGYFTLDLDDAKEYLYAKSTKRRILITASTGSYNCSNIGRSNVSGHSYAPGHC